MAVIQYTALINQIRGSINGTTFSKTKSGFSAFKKPQPRQLKSANQSRINSGFAVNANLWRTLSPAEKTDWSTLAAAHQVYNRLGDLVFISLFLRTLKKAFPEAKIWFLGKVHSNLKSLLEAIPGLEGHFPCFPRYGIRTVVDYHRISQLYRDRKFGLLIDTQRRFIPSLVASTFLSPNII